MRLLIALSLVAVFGCAPWRLPDSVNYIRTDPRIEILGLKEADEEMVVRHTLSLLAPNIRDSLRTIHIRTDKEHFTSIPRNKYDNNVVGHRCYEKARKVCILAANLNRAIIWHEATHVYAANVTDYYQDRQALYFWESWEKIAGDVYRGLDPSAVYSEIEPESEGLLTYYSRKNANEDVSEWVEECLDYLYNNSESKVFKNKHFKTDSRYRQKLEFLYKYGFFTEAQYSQLRPLFEGENK